MVTQLCCRQFPGCLRTLPECLNMYALAPAHFIYRPEIGEGYAGLESPQWKRPLPMELEIDAVKNSVFLLQLQATILQELLQVFYWHFLLFLLPFPFGLVDVQHYVFPLHSHFKDAICNTTISLSAYPYSRFNAWYAMEGSS